MKIIVNQRRDGFFSVGSNQFYNVSQLEDKLYSVGVENISFGLYKSETAALAEINALWRFLVDDKEQIYLVKEDG